MTVRAIIAADPTGIIGVNNTLPWRYKADMARFKALTMGSVLVVGRKTFESVPPPKAGPALPGRDIIIVTRNLSYDDNGRSRRLGFAALPGDSAVLADTVEGAVDCAVKDAARLGREGVWLIGGAEVYLQAVRAGLVDEIDYTVVPEVKDIPEGAEVTRLPEDFLAGFDLVSETPNETEPQLTHRTYRRCSSQPSK